jgi:excisionase family DNA binding protein
MAHADQIASVMFTRNIRYQRADVEEMAGHLRDVILTGEVAELLGVRLARVGNWIKTGKLPAVRRGWNWYVPMEDVRAFCEALRPGGSELVLSADGKKRFAVSVELAKHKVDPEPDHSPTFGRARKPGRNERVAVSSAADGLMPPERPASVRGASSKRTTRG